MELGELASTSGDNLVMTGAGLPHAKPNTLQRAARAYKQRFDADLLMTGPPDFQVKSYESHLVKNFRKNVLSNRKVPSEPAGGWIVPANWFSRINDIVTGLIVTKYLDGPPFLTDALSDEATGALGFGLLALLLRLRP